MSSQKRVSQDLPSRGPYDNARSVSCRPEECWRWTDERQASGQMFGNIEAMKRNTGNSDAADRRKSLVEQSAPEGFLRTMWTK